MPKSPPLPAAEVKRLTHYSARMKDMTLTRAKREQARKDRLSVMVSLRLAGWNLPPIAEAIGVSLSVAREQIETNMYSVDIVPVINPKGERVTPERPAQDNEYGSLHPEEVRVLQFLQPQAAKLNFSHDETRPTRRASAALDVALAYLYFAKRRETIDMARAIESSNSLVRQRIRRAIGGRPFKEATVNDLVIPEFAREDIERVLADLRKVPI